MKDTHLSFQRAFLERNIGAELIRFRNVPLARHLLLPLGTKGALEETHRVPGESERVAFAVQID